MSPTELLHLSKGRIPAWIVLTEINAYLDKHADEEGEGGLIAGIAHKGEISPDTIVTWRGQERVQSIDFDTADRILLFLLGPDAWRCDYSEYYERVNLNVKKCECPGCETMIEVVQRTKSGGAVIAKYCSQTCRQVAYQIRKGEKHQRRKTHLTGMKKCRRGHLRTPENSKLRPDGRTECKVCAREHSKRLYDSRKGSPVAAAA